MKTFKYFIIICLSFLLFSQFIFPADFQGSKWVVVYVQQNDGDTFYANGTFGIDIGEKYISEYQERERARTKFTFNLTGIPSNATINSVQLNYWISNWQNSSYKFKITQIGNYQTPQQVWQNIGQATVLFSDIFYTSGSVNSGTLTSMVNSSKGNYLYLGAFSQNEISANSWANLDLTLSITFTVPPASVSIIADNNFTGSNGTNHGVINVDGVNKTVPLTGYTFTKTISQSTSLTAISPQTDNESYQRTWHMGTTYPSEWTRNGVSAGNDQTKTFSVTSSDNGAIYKAYLRKNLNNITFQNSFVGVGNGGVIKVNGVQYNSPKTGVSVVELNPVTAQALYQVVNGIQYTFTQWNDGNTTANRTFYPATNTTYTANYSGKPLGYSIMNTHFNDIPGQNVIIYWTDHPNTNVTQYQIWRKAKRNGVVGPPALLATRNRGTTTYTDYDYEITNGYTDDLVYYDVRPYYSTESTYADPYWMSIFGELVPKTSDSTVTAKGIPDELSMSSFPNPFNPSTNIRVTMPSDGFLQVIIYNVLGEEISQLKNEMVSKGNYDFSWDGKDSGFNQVNSGIYIVFVKTDSKIISQKIVLLK